MGLKISEFFAQYSYTIICIFYSFYTQEEDELRVSLIPAHNAKYCVGRAEFLSFLSVITSKREKFAQNTVLYKDKNAYLKKSR